MIYSRWRPDTGGYDYFETDEVSNINDDLPNPVLPAATKIGVPAIEAGRPVPRGATRIGSGKVAVGVVAPVDSGLLVRRTRSLAGMEETIRSPAVIALSLAAAAGVAWYAWKRP